MLPPALVPCLASLTLCVCVCVLGAGAVLLMFGWLKEGIAKKVYFSSSLLARGKQAFHCPCLSVGLGVLLPRCPIWDFGVPWGNLANDHCVVT